MGAIATVEGKQLALIRNTVAKDCNAAEFDQFMHICRAVRLDPLRRQIYAFVFDKNKPDKRRMSIVTGIDGYRAIAERTGNYRPDNRAPRIEYSDAAKNPDTNPLGIVRAEVSVFKFAHGEWFEVVGEAYWDEFAPVKELWDNDKPTGRFQLDRKKDNWRKMARVMICKCAEAQAERKGWPDDFSGLELQEEVDRRQTIDLTATEIADAAEKDQRLERIGGPAITILWNDHEPLQRVPVGQAADRVLAFIQANKAEPTTIAVWEDRNRYALQELWAMDKSAALEVKKALEAARKAMAEIAA